MVILYNVKSMPDLEIDSKKPNTKSMPMSNARKNHDLASKIKGDIPLFWSNSTRFIFQFGDVKNMRNDREIMH